MIKTRFFVFPDEATAGYLAHQAGLTAPDEAGEPKLVRHTDMYALDVIGTVYKPTGEVDADGCGNIEPLPGWHVNARILTGDPIPASFVPFEVFPATPMQDFA